MDGVNSSQECGVERLDVGRFYLVQGIWADTKSSREEIRTWAWRQLSALERWTASGGPNEQVYEELVLLTELARLMAHSNRMEG